MGKHPHNALTALKVKSLGKPGRYADGNGLYLVVDRSGAKRWMLRTIVQGQRRDIGFGSLRLVGLAEAREKATLYRKIAREGGDPLEARRREQRVVPTFAEAARRVHEQHRNAWRNRKHRDQWINTLEAHVIPEIGNLRVDKVSTSEILKVLGPLWLTKPETARRVKQRIGSVLDWATASGHRQGESGSQRREGPATTTRS